MEGKHERSHILAAKIRRKNGMGKSDEKEKPGLLEEGCLPTDESKIYLLYFQSVSLVLCNLTTCERKLTLPLL